MWTRGNVNLWKTAKVKIKAPYYKQEIGWKSIQWIVNHLSTFLYLALWSIVVNLTSFQITNWRFPLREKWPIKSKEIKNLITWAFPVKEFSQLTFHGHKANTKIYHIIIRTEDVFACSMVWERKKNKCSFSRVGSQ